MCDSGGSGRGIGLIRIISVLNYILVQCVGQV